MELGFNNYTESVIDGPNQECKKPLIPRIKSVKTRFYEQNKKR